MGRNSEKRRVRRDARVTEEHDARDRRTAESALRRGLGGASAMTPWWVDSLRAGTFEEGPEPTLSAALFRVSALLVATPILLDDGEDPALGAVCEELARLLSVDTLSVHWLVDEPAPSLVRVGTSRRLDSDAPLLQLTMESPYVQQCMTSQQVVVVEDPARDPSCLNAHGQRTHVGSMLLCPLRYRDEVRGVLVVSRREVRGFYEADQRRLLVVAAALAQDLEQGRQLREAMIDPETGLLSRMALLEALPREFERARRYGTPLSVLMLHIDGLRDVAERYGDVVTRELMADVGRRLPHSVRRADLTVRFGADVFLVLSPVGAEDAAAGCERLLGTATERGFTAGDLQIPLVLSASAATLDEGDDDAFALLLRAEASLPVPVVRRARRPEGTVDPVGRHG